MDQEHIPPIPRTHTGLLGYPLVDLRNARRRIQERTLRISETFQESPSFILADPSIVCERQTDRDRTIVGKELEPKVPRPTIQPSWKYGLNRLPEVNLPLLGSPYTPGS